MAPVIQRLSHIHCEPEMLACTKNNTRPGIHVIQDKVMNSTDIFPSTYSVRDSGTAEIEGKSAIRQVG